MIRTSILAITHKWRHMFLLPFNLRLASETMLSFHVMCLRHK